MLLFDTNRWYCTWRRNSRVKHIAWRCRYKNVLLHQICQWIRLWWSCNPYRWYRCRCVGLILTSLHQLKNLYSPWMWIKKAVNRVKERWIVKTAVRCIAYCPCANRMQLNKFHPRNRERKSLQNLCTKLSLYRCIFTVSWVWSSPTKCHRSLGTIFLSPAQFLTRQRYHWSQI